MTEYNLEATILRNLVSNQDYMRKVIPFIKTNYFVGPYRIVFKEICKFISKYNKLPTQETLSIEIDQRQNIQPEVYQLIPEIFKSEKIDDQWLLDKTEQWCQDRAIHIAIFESIDIIDGKNERLSKGAIPELLSKALSVSFDTSIGHDYLNDIEARYEFYHSDKERIPFDLEMMNKITGGGIARKTLNIIMAGTGSGKSLFMCHQAAASLSMGYNVLYLTMEMSEEKVAERIDANLLNVPINQIKELPKTLFAEKVNKIKKTTTGSLIVKEYPTGWPNANHFRALLNELKIKKNFIPDIIFVDYINICSSARVKNGSDSYGFVKAIAEEIRGLAVEFNVPIVSATQTNRSGYGSSDPGLENTAESFGLPQTSDLLFALVSDENLENDNQIMVKQLKNRDNDMNPRRFLLGIDRRYMKLYDLEESTQTELIQEDTKPKIDKAKEFIF